VQTLAQSVLEYMRRQRLLKAGDRICIAVSGGADSVALLRLLLELRRELGVVLLVVHFNHKLRGAEADADEQFVAELAARHKLELHCGSGNVSAFATEQHLSIEAAARKLRYDYFRSLFQKAHLNRIATAHTLDDQAETVLLRITRGAGTRGLAGIYPQLSVSGSQFSDSGQPSAVSCQEKPSSIIRPLLAIRRTELETYLNALKQGWREDSSNRDLRYTRNRIRHGILPRLERDMNPAVREALAETAEIARAEEEYWENAVELAWPLARDPGATLVLSKLLALPLALQRRVLRAAAESLGLRLEFRQVEEILDAATAKKIALPGGWVVWRRAGELKFERVTPQATPDYEYCLPVPGRVEVPEVGAWFEAALVPAGAKPGYNPENLLNATLLTKELTVRNWRAGDRFWPAHTKSAKKIKELLQERHVSGPERKLWPVVVSGDKVVWMRGFAVAAESQLREEAEQALLILELRK
jgi:tRNA(Ile)-lysidine synthase